MNRLWMALVCGLLFSGSLAADQTKGQQGVYLAPGWGSLAFEAPAPGTYALPPLQDAAGGTLLDSNGEPVELAELLDDKVTLLGFIYRTCDDVNGCPLSTMVLRTVAKRLRQQPALADALRVVTISFDPKHDTPKAMAHYRDAIVGDANLDWHFLTGESDDAIKPLLDAYQQFVVADTSRPGAGKFSHILRVYLIDPDAQVRNIYNLSFLHPDILVNDVQTLVMEMEEANTSVAATP